MKKVYITGICGLLGNNIVKELSSKYEIAGVDLADEQLFGCHKECFDLKDQRALKESILKFKPDILIHTAAAVNVDRCETERNFAYELNVGVTKNLVQICREQHIKMIYISTDAVYNGEKKELYCENDQVAPVNYYGTTKLAGEQEVQKLEDYLILRTNIYGVNIQEKKSFGEWIVDALNKGEELRMFKDIYFSPIVVNELAQLIDKCIEKNLIGLYHACATGDISKYEFALLVKDIFEIKTGNIIKTVSDERNFIAKRAKNMGMSNEKLKQELGVKISTPKESIMCLKHYMII